MNIIILYYFTLIYLYYFNLYLCIEPLISNEKYTPIATNKGSSNSMNMNTTTGSPCNSMSGDRFHSPNFMDSQDIGNCHGTVSSTGCSIEAIEDEAFDWIGVKVTVQ